MKQFGILSLAGLLFSQIAFAKIEFSVGGGQSSALVESSIGAEDITIQSPNVNVYFGYMLKSFPLSFGLFVSQKNFDMAEVTKEQSSNAESFYENSTIFPTRADITSSEASGSWSGFVYGGQVSVSPGWKYFDPYIRTSYQVGTLKSVLDFKSDGDYMGDAISYDFKIENDFQATVLQYGLGFRIPMGALFVYADYSIEKTTLTSGDMTYTSRSTVAGVEDISVITDSESTSDNFEGSALSAGLGLSF